MTSTKTPSPTGRQYELRHGDQVAVVTEVGAALRLYRVGDRDVVVPFGEHELPPAVHGAVLLPWPNRIGDGTYEFDGATYRLDLSEPERHNAIHGLVRHTRWRCADVGESSIEMALELVPRVGYPFPLESRVRYDLGPDGLSVSLVTTNLGDVDAPYGAGFHPWLSPGAHRLEDCRLSMDVETRVEVDDRLLPVAETTDIPTDVDFRSRRRVGETRLDDGFAAHGTHPEVRLTDPDGVTAFVQAVEGVRYWQVFTGDGLPQRWLRSGLAAEPMTCAADAFRTGRHLLRLGPGRSHTTRFVLGLRAS